MARLILGVKHGHVAVDSPYSMSTPPTHKSTMPALTGITIVTEHDADGAMVHEIDSRLVETLRQNVPPNDAQPLTLVARRSGDLIGGLAGATFELQAGYW